MGYRVRGGRRAANPKIFLFINAAVRRVSTAAVPCHPHQDLGAAMCPVLSVRVPIFSLRTFIDAISRARKPWWVAGPLYFTRIFVIKLRNILRARPNGPGEGTRGAGAGSLGDVGGQGPAPALAARSGAVVLPTPNSSGENENIVADAAGRRRAGPPEVHAAPPGALRSEFHAPVPLD